MGAERLALFCLQVHFQIFQNIIGNMQTRLGKSAGLCRNVLGSAARLVKIVWDTDIRTIAFQSGVEKYVS